MKSTEKNGQWTYIFPIYGVSLSECIGREIRINCVTIIALDKLKRVFKRRYGSTKSLKELLNESIFIDNEKVNTFIVVQQSGVPKEIRDKVINLVNDAINVLASSLLLFSQRNKYHISSNSRFRGNSFGFIGVEKNENYGFESVESKRSNAQINLESRWARYHKKSFFKIFLNSKKYSRKISNGWKETLWKAASLMGESYQTENIAHAFLLNMITLEMLLIDRNDKESVELPRRIDGLLGWAGEELSRPLKPIVEGLYKKRCKFVHEGNLKEITLENLKLLDEICFNVLSNLVNCIDVFKGKEDIKNYCDKLDAANLLNMKPPLAKRLQYRGYGW